MLGSATQAVASQPVMVWYSTVGSTMILASARATDAHASNVTIEMILLLIVRSFPRYGFINAKSERPAKDILQIKYLENIAFLL
ncbi:MAG: hypothetical protein ISS79_04290 [Phycisphaerae bacterium]|nr:hypothetical protein [Phycisphaerae bacterium]